MKCAKCVELGLKSRVYEPMGCISTDMAFSPYYDEEGVRHYHDGNSMHETWTCGQGHKWHHSWQRKCPAENCGWNETRMDKVVFEEPKPATASS